MKTIKRSTNLISQSLHGGRKSVFPAIFRTSEPIHSTMEDIYIYTNI